MNEYGNQKRTCRWKKALVVLLAAITGSAMAGGLGHNMLVLVNANSEEALRIAHTYQKLRHIPDENFIFIDPPDRSGRDSAIVQEDFPGTGGTKTEFTDTFRTPIEIWLADHPHLTNQVDYIGFIDLPYYVNIASTFGSTLQSSSAMLSILSLTAEDPTNNLLYTRVKTSPLVENAGVSNGYVRGSNEAIHHRTLYDNEELMNPHSGFESGHYYMGGIIAYTGFQGNSVDDVIRSMTRAAGADGAHPQGTIYFEKNDDVRSNIREPNWALTQPELDARGILWVESSDTPGSTPLNRPDVRGAICGKAVLNLPNGSTYLPGSYADNLTSFGMQFYGLSQHTAKASRFISAGAAATAGTIAEPGGTQKKFTYPMIHAIIDDGSTLGEAYFKTVVWGQRCESAFLGDMLAQPYADVPVVQFDAGSPADGSTVSGVVAIAASAFVVTSDLTTAVAELRLYVDGGHAATLSGDSGIFSLDTTALSDGWHELRVVGMNNSQAASEGLVLHGIFVDNHGRSLTVSEESYSVGQDATVSFSLSTTAGDGTIDRLELRHMGRTLGQVGGAGGNIYLSASDLAFGSNTVKAVAIFDDGDEVAAAPFIVVRERNAFPSVVAPRIRRAGFKSEYFFGKGGSSIAASDFSSSADVTVTDLEKINIGVFDGSSTFTKLDNAQESIIPLPVASPSDLSNLVNLASRYTAWITVPEAGEYTFFFYNSTESGLLLVDEQEVLEFSNITWGMLTHWGETVYLGAGEHKIEVRMAKDANGNFFDTSVYMRGPTGTTEVINRASVYQFFDLPSGIFLRETFDGAAQMASGNIDGNHLWTASGEAADTASFDPVGGGNALRLTAADVAFCAVSPFVSNTVVEAEWQVALPITETGCAADLLLADENGAGVVFRAELDQSGSQFILDLFTTPEAGGTLMKFGSGVLDADVEHNVFHQFNVVWDQAQGTFELRVNGMLLSTVSDGTVQAFSEAELSLGFGSAILVDNVVLREYQEPFSIPFHETFENNGSMAGSLGLVDGQHGWKAFSSSAVVQAEEAWELDQAVSIQNSQIEQVLEKLSPDVWAAFAWKPAASRAVAAADIPAGASAVFWVNTGGNLCAYSNQIPVEITGANVDTNQWVRVLVRNDYTQGRWSLWLDGTPVISGFGFYTNVTGGKVKLTFSNRADGPVYVDDIHVTATAWNPQPGDTDGDGLGDAWERIWFRSPNVLTNASEDYDGDGMSNGEEEVAGTNPANAQSVFRVADFQFQEGGGWVIRWPSVTGRVYAVDFATNLMDGVWSNLENSIPSTPPENVYTAQVDHVNAWFSRIRARKQQFMILDDKD